MGIVHRLGRSQNDATRDINCHILGDFSVVAGMVAGPDIQKSDVVRDVYGVDE